ncbi:serine/threonine protein kinase [Glycomyces sp. A-F 0318]|uniref:serine/threonine-protein kinase n=1 Tax=Glycomyces amatae TaxID=2881355 RepID=UPI001E6306C5|nr:serine/threonine-protein kinase [Glycomyces amatae]MCD0445032.1 serine/threonine protein kinase [Glycomyces amatae]
MEPGTLIADRYRLDEVIASGGMGTVWRGFDTRLKRAVAVKILKTGFEDDDTARARFEHEAQSVAALRHTGIAALYDYSDMEDETGAVLSYLVMELIEGRSLTARLLAGPLEPAEAMRLCAQVAEALQCAHEAGIVHRDVKPANIILDGRGRAVLVDFGIALSAGRAAITETGMLLGTLYYASPEQLEGRELNYATDVYSLGAVAYECLAGNPPFTGDTAGTILNGHLNRPPPPLPETVPPEAAATVLRALAKQPDRRWPSAAALAAAATGRPLPPNVFDTPGPAAPATPFDTTTALRREPLKPKRRRRIVLVAAAIAAVAAAAAAVALPPLLDTAEDGEGGVFGAYGSVDPSNGEAMPSDAASNSETSTSDTASAEEHEAATTEADDHDEGTGGSGGGDPADEDTGGEPGTVDGGAATLPDLWGLHFEEAWTELYRAGWENLRLATSDADPGTGQTECTVLHLDPEGGTPAHYDEQVTITYLEFAPGNC